MNSNLKLNLMKYLETLGYKITCAPLSINNTNKSFEQLLADIFHGLSLSFNEPNLIAEMPNKKSSSPIQNFKPSPPLPSRSIKKEDQSPKIKIIVPKTDAIKKKPVIIKKEMPDKPFSLAGKSGDRKAILDRMTDKYGEYPKITSEMMNEIYRYYDENFFDNSLSKQVKSSGIIFETSEKASKVAGSVTMSSPIRIMLSTKIFYEVTEENVSFITANGLNIINRMDAILRVMEHELTHLLLSTSGDNDHIIENHGDLFKSIVFDLFGHKDIKHDLIISKDHINKQRLTKDTVKINDKVSFMLKNKSVTGNVLKKNPKRAVIKLDDGRVRNVNYQFMYAMTADEVEIVPLSKDTINIGDNVKFKHEGSSMTGKILKKNPKRAIIELADGSELSIEYALLFV